VAERLSQVEAEAVFITQAKTTQNFRVVTYETTAGSVWVLPMVCPSSRDKKDSAVIKAKKTEPVRGLVVSTNHSNH